MTLAMNPLASPERFTVRPQPKRRFAGSETANALSRNSSHV
jgi:hypothetical protein